MDDRFSPRLHEILEESVCGPELTEGTLERLADFLVPFAESMTEPEQRTHTREYVQGLLSKLERKTGESIAYFQDQDRQGMQKYLGQVPWDHQPLLKTLAKQVGERIGAADGVIVFDPSAFAKKGTKSVGVKRQWCGRLGKVDNCQVGVFMGYVSRQEHALVDMRLFLTTDWAGDRKRRLAAGVPAETKFQTRHELALEMLDAQGKSLPHAWVTGDDEMGRPAEFREALRERGENDLLAVPSNTLVRDLEVEPPPYGGRGRPSARPFRRVKTWCAALPDAAWTKLDVRDGEKGPLVIEAVKCPVTAKLGAAAGPEELLFATRELQSDGSYKRDYYLAHTDTNNVSLMELARVAKAEHRVEECIKRCKGEAGMADYQVRNWIGWHHHIALSLLAMWFLIGEVQRGKKTYPRADRSTPPRPDRERARRPARVQPAGQRPTPGNPLAATKRTSTLLPLPRA